MKVFYLKRGKEELRMAKNLLNNLNDESAEKIITHLGKSMEFIVDFLNNEHTDLINNLPFHKELINEVIGEDFIETYLYLKTLEKHSIRVLNNNNILIDGKMIGNVNDEHFHKLVNEVVKYFNKVYTKTENGLFWK